MPPRFVSGMTFIRLCLTLELLMGLYVQSTVGCFSDLYFFLVFVSQVLVGLRKQFMNNFVFTTWPCGAVFNNDDNINDKPNIHQ